MAEPKPKDGVRMLSASDIEGVVFCIGRRLGSDPGRDCDTCEGKGWIHGGLEDCPDCEPSDE